MEFANQSLPQPSSLLNNLILVEEPKNPNEGEEEDNALVTFQDNSTYKGSWQNGKKHGSGVLTLSNSDKYTGDFSEDKIEGRGVYTWSSGQQYEGDWVDNKYNGKGKFIFHSEVDTETNQMKYVYYEGDFEKGKSKVKVNM